MQDSSYDEIQYGVSTLGAIRDKVAGYAGDAAILRELVQNADDARAEWIELHITDDALIVRNSSIFTDRDFSAIAEIASGSKRRDDDTTGTWGVGFLSIYQITDRPEVHSGGFHYTFVPENGKARMALSTVEDHTEFCFPWRREQTQIWTEIEVGDAGIWNRERVTEFQKALVPETYRVLPFLRNVRRIAVFGGPEGRTLYHSVERKQVRTEHIAKILREEWEFTAFDHRRGEKVEPWVTYHDQLDRGFVRYGQQLKRPDVAFGFGPERPLLAPDLKGTLYNYLPTGIETGFALHLHGDFFPDPNRTTIRTDASEQGDWNRTVIRGLSRLVADSLANMRSSSASPEDFYRLLPTSLSDQASFLQPVLDQVKERARSLEIVETTDDRWTRANAVRLRDDEALAALAEDHLPAIAPKGLPRRVREFIHGLGARSLQLNDLLEFVRTNVRNGTPLKDAHPIARERKTLDRILERVQRGVSSARNDKDREEVLHDFRRAPLCLDAEGNLVVPAADLYLMDDMDDETRALVAGQGIREVDREFARRHQALLTAVLPTFDVGALITLLERITSLGRGGGAAAPPSLLSSEERLVRLYGYLRERAGQLGPNEIARLRRIPFVQTQTGRLAPIEGPSGKLLLPMESGRDLDLPEEMLELADVIKPSVVRGPLRYFFHAALGVQPLSRPDFIEQCVVHRYQDARLDDAARLKLLQFVRRELPDIHQQSPRLLHALRASALIRCADEIYRRADQVYFPSEGLNAVFPRGYPQPHAVYGMGPPPGGRGQTGQPAELSHYTSDWYPLFRDLGMQTHPTPTDLVEAVRHVVDEGTRPIDQGVEQIRHIYDVLNAYTPEHFKIAATSLNPLLGLRWLPAEKDRSRWYAPGELYSSTWRDVIESQAAVLPFRQPSVPLSQFFGVNNTPRVEHVVEHLLWLSDHGQPVNNRIYTFLSDALQDNALSASLIARMRERPVIYDHAHERFWRPDKVFLFNHVEEFGEYRCYLGPNNVGTRQRLFTELGVRDKPDAVLDYVATLEEIVDSKRNLPLSDHDRYVINQIYGRLGAALQSHGSRERARAEIAKIMDLPLVIDQESRLVIPTQAFFKDAQQLLDKFPAGSIRTAYYRDIDGTSRVFLAHVGVAPLSQAVHRTVRRADAPARDFATTARLRALTPQIQRLIEHHQLHHPDGWADAAFLKSIEVYQVANLEAQHVLRTESLDLEGSIEAQDAVYDRKDKLYVSDHALASTRNMKLAAELASALNPAFDRSALAPILDKLLSSELSQADAVLDAFEVSRSSASEEQLRLGEDTIASAVAQVGVPGHAEDEDGEKEDPTLTADTEELLSFWPAILSISVPQSQTQGIVPADSLVPGPYSSADDWRVQMEPTSPGEWEEVLASLTKMSGSEQLQAPETPVEAEEPSLDTLPAALLSVDANVAEGEDVTPVVSRGGTPGTPDKRRTEENTEESSAIPPFTGRIRPWVPVISTNPVELKKRYGVSWLGARTLEHMGDLMRADPAGTGVERVTDDHERIQRARFILTFQGCNEGFLPITESAQRLLYGQANEIVCSTDEGHSFPLYVDRAKGIIYNQENLPKYFQSRIIPPGAIIYLEREHGERFRLYVNSVPHVVHDVRIAMLNEDGALQYETLPEVSVLCEIDEMVFRAEKRLEDSDALFTEAEGKDSFGATICQVFVSSERDRIHEDELFHLVSAIRMVSATTVRNELRRHPCLVSEGDGFWHLDHARPYWASPLSRRERPPLLNTNRASAISGSRRHEEFHGNEDPSEEPDGGPQLSADQQPGGQRPSLPRQAESPLRGVYLPPQAPSEIAEELASSLAAISDQIEVLSGDDERFPPVLRRFRDPFNTFIAQVERHYYLLNQSSESSGANQNSRHSPKDELLAHLQMELADIRSDTGGSEKIVQFALLLEGVIQDIFASDSPDDGELVRVLMVADASTWEVCIRGILDRVASGFEVEQRFDSARAVLMLEERCTGRLANPSRLKQLESRQRANRLIAQCDGNGATEDELALLEEAIHLDSARKDAHGLYRTRAEAVLAPVLLDARAQATNGDLGRASELLDDALQFLRRREELVPDMRRLQDELDEACEYVFSCAIGRAQSQGASPLGLQGEDAWLLAARPYHLLSSSKKRERHAFDYLRALEEAGDASIKQGQPCDAAVIYQAAIDFWLNTTHSVTDPRLVRLRSRLANAYEALGLWDLSVETWRDLKKVLAGREFATTIQRFDKALQRNQELHLQQSAVHEQFVRQLKRIADGTLASIVGSDPIQRMIENEERQARRLA